MRGEGTPLEPETGRAHHGVAVDADFGGRLVAEEAEQGGCQAVGADVGDGEQVARCGELEWQGFVPGVQR
jgi:hypothetical protein